MVVVRLIIDLPLIPPIRVKCIVPAYPAHHVGHVQLGVKSVLVPRFSRICPVHGRFVKSVRNCRQSTIARRRRFDRECHLAVGYGLLRLFNASPDPNHDPE